MHIYIYDNFVNEKKYTSTLAKIETRTTDLGLNGKIIRLKIIKNIQNALKNEINRGAKTIIAVGNNVTINKIINAMIKTENLTNIGRDIPLGIIPIGTKNNEIANSLGIRTEEEACDCISARRIEKLDIAQANDQYFLSHASIQSHGSIIEINNNYSIEIMEKGFISIINIPHNNTFNKFKFNPKNGILKLFIETKSLKKILKWQKPNQSFFSLNKLTITSKYNSLLLDNSVKIPTPVKINIIKNRLNIIVGKERNF